jgi:hypothetical protein
MAELPKEKYPFDGAGHFFSLIGTTVWQDDFGSLTTESISLNWSLCLTAKVSLIIGANTTGQTRERGKFFTEKGGKSYVQ